MTENLTIRGLQSSDAWDHENGFYWFSDATRLGKLVAHYELYKRIVDLPGDVCECGVYKAASLIRLATYRELLEAKHSRRIVAFDAFGAFPTEAVAGAADRHFIEKFEKAGGDGLSAEEVEKILVRKGLWGDIELKRGDLRETIPDYIATRPAWRVSLLHLDVDVYEPTKFALELLWERIVPGGLVVIDDYNGVRGATDAVDEFLAAHARVRIQKLTSAHAPAFISKD